MRRLTTEEFISRAKNIHGDTYDYSQTEYKSAHEKIKIICKEHGMFEQSANKHYCGQGCPKCVGKNRNTKEFIAECVKIHGNKYDYSLVNFTKNSDKIHVICKKHGKFDIIAGKHIVGSGCPSCCVTNKKNTEWFIKKSKEKHGEKYLYNKSVYINSKTKITVTCIIHGDFKVNPSNHYRLGSECYNCYIDNRTITKDDFINKSKATHGNRYDYYITNYTTCNHKLNIICRQHGVFSQIAISHYSGQGCPECANISNSRHQKRLPKGWNITNWNKSALISKKFDSFKVYIIRCWNDNEQFYKIGRTFTTIENRFSNKSVNMPYKYEVIKEIVFDTAKEAFDKENELKRNNKENKYIPKINFKGMYECFKLTPLRLSSV